MKIAVDAMGGDFAPKEIVLGAIMAAKKHQAEIVLVGDEPSIKKILEEEKAKDLPITIKHSTEVIGMDEHPADAVRTKKDASVVVATNLVKTGECAAVISAGSTGAAVTAAIFNLKRIKGIDRPAIATPMPTPNGATIMLDSGANVDSKPEHLAKNAIMGSLYAEYVLKMENPRVGLLNIGEEETKGNEQTKEAYALLKNTDINFIGNAEGRDVPKGNFDVVVCDGFVGNVVLKFAEGMAKTIFNLIKEAIKEGGVLGKIGAALLTPTLKKLAKKLDVAEYGGAPLLGIDGYVIICHGSSNAKSISSAIRAAKAYVESDVVNKIKNALATRNDPGNGIC